MRTAAGCKWIEDWIDGATATAFASAVAFAVGKLAPQPGTAVFAASIVAFGGCWAALRLVPGQRRLAIPDFGLAEFDAEQAGAELEELLLTDELIVHDAAARDTSEDELLLDDVLGALGPDSRVVRLFAPGDLPTPGQLQSRIDRHLQARRAPQPIPDASEALSEALAQLRRSLR